MMAVEYIQGSGRVCFKQTQGNRGELGGRGLSEKPILDIWFSHLRLRLWRQEEEVTAKLR